MQKTERLVAITLLLQARGKMTAERLASILEVSVRTIYRDMDSLSLAHVPVAMDYGPGGGYYLPEDYRLDPSTFTSDEVVALALGGAMAGGYRLFESGDELCRALFKLEAALPDEYRADVRAARERILFDVTDWHQQPAPATPYLEPIRRAVWGGRQLDILYARYDGSEVRWRRVEPYGLVSKAGVWYLVAYCHLRKDFRTFRVSRIQDLTVREEPVALRPEFDLQAYWEEARQRFEGQVLPFALTLRVAPFLLHRVGGGSTILGREPDGSVLLRLDLESREAAIFRALGLGASAAIVDPPDLREDVAAEARRVAAMYEAASPAVYQASTPGP